MSENIVVDGIEYEEIEAPQLTVNDKKEIWRKFFRWFIFYVVLIFAEATTGFIFVNINYENGASILVALFMVLILTGILVVPMWFSAQKKARLKRCQTCGNEYRTVSYDLGNITEYVTFCTTCGKAFSEKFAKSGSENVNL